jgi:serine/threonine-protein kinase
VIGSTLGHNRILAKLGEGGMGVVHLAEDEHLKRNVALKMLPPALAADPVRLARFEREVKAVAALNHPNIVAI